MRIKNKKDLPEWANPEKYAVFAKMNDEEFINQIIYRVLDSLDGYSDNVEYYNEVVKHEGEKWCRHGTHPSNEGAMGPYQKIMSDLAVTPLSVSDIGYLHDWLMDFDTIAEKEFEEERCIDREFNTHIDIYMKRKYDRLINCALDLSFNDDIIIASIKKLLPVWRAQLSMPMVSGDLNEIKTSWGVNRNKIISYHIKVFYFMT